MSNIKQYLDNIMKAIYGREVRQSIHDAIEEIDKVADTAQGSATEMAKTAEEAATRAERYKTEAEESAEAAGIAEESANAAKEYVANCAKEANNSKMLAANAAAEATEAKETVLQKAEEADASASSAKGSEQAAKLAEKMAENHSDIATDKAEEAAASANKALVGANSAEASKIAAESYARGCTGTREGEDTDNAKYYKEQAERITQGLAGGLLPMGTVTFEQLSEQTKHTGYMYDISNDFTTTEEFKEGAGHVYAAGTNVYWTADGYWDCLPGSNLVGVKGEAEDSYQTGFAIITRKGLGLDHVENTSDKDKPVSDKQQAALDKKFDKDGDLGENTVAFESGDALNPTGWANIDLITGGEKNKGLLRKLSLAVKNLRYLYKLIGSADISKIGNGTVTGAISGLNSNLGSTNNRLDNIGTVGIGYMNAYGDKSHHVGLTFETYADRSIPAIVIDGTLFHIVPNNASETKRGKIGDMYVDFESSPWRLVIVFCVDGSQYKQYVTLADL